MTPKSTLKHVSIRMSPELHAAATGGDDVEGEGNAMIDQKELAPVVICEYCGKQIEPEDLEFKRIYSPNWNSGRSMPREYHKSKKCAEHDQMAHEG